MLRIVRSLIFLFAIGLLNGCGGDDNKISMPDHYAVLDGPQPPVSKNIPPAAIVILEMIEVDDRLLNDWTLEHSLDPTRATPLRREVQEWIRQGKAQIVETSAIHVQNKQRAKTSSVREIIYPAEYRYPVKTTKNKHFIASAILLLGAAGILFAQNPPAKPPPKNGLVTISYKVPATFMSSYSKGPRAGSSDPFAAPEDNSGGVIGTRKTSKQILESAGITHATGATAIYNAETGTLIVRNTKDQHQLIQAYLDSLVGGSEKQIQVIVEMIEVEHLDFSDWLLGNRLNSGANELRTAVQKWIAGDRGKIIETVVCTVKSRQRGKTRSGDEYVFPSEFHPPEVPGKVTLSGKATVPVTQVSTTAFKTKNLGITLEVDSVL